MSGDSAQDKMGSAPEPPTASAQAAPAEAVESMPGGEVAAAAKATGNGLMCIDQWDWKTDAPEFVPGGMGALIGAAPEGQGVNAAAEAPAAGPGGCDGGWGMVPAPAAGRGPPGGSLVNASGGSAEGTRVVQLQAQFEWQLQTKSEELSEMQSQMNQLEIETAQAKASWDSQRRSLVRQVGQYRGVLERYCIPLQEASSGTLDNAAAGSWSDPSASSQWAGAAAGHAGALAGAHVGPGGGGGAEGGGERAPSSLDSKMRQLNSLLQEGSSTRRRGAQDAAGAADAEALAQPAKEGPDGGAGKGYSSGTVATALRHMFPHATIRTSKPIGDDKDVADGTGDQEARGIEQVMRRLERQTTSHVDERAMRALTSLNAKDAREALGKVDELVTAQGGTCRNLSSILQSVCRKIEKRSGKAPRGEDEGFARPLERLHADSGGAAGGASRSAGVASLSAGDGKAAAADGPRPSRARRLADEDGDAFAAASSSDSDRGGKDADERPRRKNAPKALGDAVTMVRSTSMTSQSSNVGQDTPGGKRSNRSWADIHSGDEDDEEVFDESAFAPASPREQDAEDLWTAQRVEKAAQRGFEMRRRGDAWELKISMASLEPALTEAGMERYCQWLGERLAALREEHGDEVLRHCHGEVDFSHNGMTNEMVWMLLDKLAQNEVHAALLKLFGNRISQGGVLAICEFIRKNERAEALQELHLSHNEIDDDSALELLRVLQSQRPRYPPKRLQEGTNSERLVPVWLRLNHNRISSPDFVRKTAETEGISICPACDRQACGTSKCCREVCPLVHLYSFNMQARRRPSPGSPEQAAPPLDAASPEQDGGADRQEGDADGYSPSRKKRTGKRTSKDKKDADDAVE